MKKTNLKIIAILIILFITNSLYSQTLTEVFSNPDLNYFQIQEQINNNKSIVDSAEEGIQKRYYRWQTFWDTRIDEKGSFVTYGNQIQQYSENFIPNKNTNNLWKNLGPSPELLTHPYNDEGDIYKHIGRVQSIWVNPADTSEILLGTSNAGLWKTTNGGQEWNRLTNNLSFGVHSIQVDTENNIIYIATHTYANGLINHGHYGHGIMKSTDNGATWETIYNNQEGRLGVQVLLYSEITETLYAVAGDFFIKSTNQGVTWQEIDIVEQIGHSISIRNISQNQTNTNQFVLSGRSTLIISNNEGVNWIDKENCVSFNAWFAADYSQEGTLWINACRDYDGGDDKSDLLKSYDNSESFTPTFTNEYFGGTTGAVVILNAFTDDCIYTGGGSIVKITNNGTVWNYATKYQGVNTHADIREIYFPDPTNPDLTYIVTDGGVNKTTTGGVNYNYPTSGSKDKEWQRIYGNLALNECYSIAISEQNPEIMLMGAHDNGSYRRHADGTWKHVVGGDGGEALIGTINDNIMFANVNRKLVRSENGGDNFSYTQYYHLGVLKNFKRAAHDSPILSHPDSANIFYAASQAEGCGLVCKSIDGGQIFPKDSEQWSSTTPIDSTWTFAWGVISAMDISKSNPAVFHYSNYDPWGTEFFDTKIKYTSDYGNNWQVFNFGENCMQQTETMFVKITEIEIHPTNPDIVFVSVGNFHDDKKIFQTTDSWETWQNISYDLPNIPVNTISYDQHNDWLFVGTDVGLFYLTDITNRSDSTWERYGDFPLSICSDIKINEQTHELVAATYGRGVWRADIGCQYNETPQSITTNTTWDGTRTITNDWEIESGATLTIPAGAYIKFVPEASLIVQPGGKLIINGGKLTNSCGEMWQGITVLGNSELPQWNISNQGYLEVKNGAIIENAQSAIFVGDKEIPWGEQNGGIVKIDGAIFRNNVACVEMPKYQNYAFNIPEIQTRNVSYIRNSTFETTDELAQLDKKPYAFISLWAVDGVSITNNTFKNLNPESYSISERGKGIRTWSANYYSKYNTFENLKYGVYSDGIGELSSFKIDTCNFTGNYNAIRLNGVNNAVVTRNTINYSGINISYVTGITISNSNDFTIEENTLNGHTNDFIDGGILLYNNEQTNSSIYKNEFENINWGVISGNNPELLFECNEFFGNTEYGIYIYDDIAWAQGTATHPTANKFLETSNTYDIYSDNNIIGYFYDAENDFIPTKINNDKIILYQSHPDYSNECPSHFGNGNPWQIDTIIALDYMIQQKQTELNEIVDGGNTDNTVSDVQNSNPDEALKLRNSLLEKSPNLSDTVMITTITEENILPKIMLTEVLTANSQSAKSENVTQALDNRDDQLPNYLRDEINTGRDSISTKEELEISIFELKNKKARIYNEKVRYFLTDTVQSSKDSLLYLLENENNLTGKYRLLSYYISKKDHVNAEIVLNSIETEFELTARQQVEYDKMVIFTNIQLNLFENNKTYFEVDSIQRQKLYLLSEDTLSQAGTYARSVISLIDRVEYDFNFSFPENKPKDFAPPPSQPELIFNLTPNPAKDYFVAEYELPLSNFTNARFTMYNYDNVKVYERTLNKRAYQLLVETEEFIPGTYICKLNADGKEFTQKLITIKADQMTNEQTEHSEQIKNSELQNVTNYLAIFPNPANDFVVVKYNFEDRDFTIGNIIFTDNTGKTVKTEPIATNTRQQTISTTDLAKGMYNISIQLDGIIIETNKVIIE